MFPNQHCQSFGGVRLILDLFVVLGSFKLVFCVLLSVSVRILKMPGRMSWTAKKVFKGRVVAGTREVSSQHCNQTSFLFNSFLVSL